MKFRYLLAAAASLAVMSGAAIAQDAGDAAKGEKVFRKCKACHNAEKEQNKVGPHLVGIVGRQAASVDGYKYGKALTAAAEKIGTWDEAEIIEYLADPKGFVGGRSKMTFKLKDLEDRQDVVAYLASLGKTQ
jgi:cytochrome c